MSEQNVELIRRGYEAFARRDYDAAREMFDQEAEWHPYLGLVGSGVYRGRDAIERMLREIDVDLEFVLEAEEFVDLGDQVLVPVRGHGKGRESGAEVEAHWFQLWRLRDGRIVEVSAFGDRGAAMRAAGAAD